MRLHSFNHKRAPKFKGTGAYHLGIELEVEAPDHPKRDEGLALAKRPRNFYAKHDGSLNAYGWELVTHPVAKELWLAKKASGAVISIFKMVKDLQGLGYNSHDGGRCGLHIHLDRKAFSGGWASVHGYWFAKLVAGNLFKRLSQRTDSALNAFARQTPPKITWKATDYYAGNRHARTAQVITGSGRYVAVNITRDTAEIRIFRGNMREDRIRKALEAVIAATEFTRKLTSRDLGKDLDREFVGYILLRPKTYPNLARYLGEIGVVKPAEDDSGKVAIELGELVSV